MKIAVIGGGAMGSIYAALMAEHGHAVCMIDKWKEHISEIKTNGLYVHGASGERRIHSINVSTDINVASGSELYIIATKTSQVEMVAEALSTFIGDNELIITIQNGLGSADLVAKHLKPENLFLGVAEGFGASVTAPGHVHHNAMNLIRLGELIKNDFTRVISLANLWTQSGFNAKPFEDINQLVWEKFLCNVTFSGPCAAFQITIGELMANEKYWKIAIGCMKEAYTLGIDRAIPFSFSDPEKYVTNFGNRMPKAKPSMLLDHENCRLSEIDAINGMVVSLGEAMGVKTPYNETITALILNKEKMIA
jgi:2-dehydropantoate 2-reductase